MNGGGLDCVIVVQDQCGLGLERCELVQERSQDRLDWRRLMGLQGGERRVADAELHLLQSQDDVAPKARRIVVGGVQRYPGHPARMRCGCPCAQERSLTPAWRRGDQRERAVKTARQSVDEAGTINQGRCRGRDEQLGREELTKTRVRRIEAAVPGRTCICGERHVANHVNTRAARSARLSLGRARSRSGARMSPQAWSP